MKLLKMGLVKWKKKYINHDSLVILGEMHINVKKLVKNHNLNVKSLEINLLKWSL